MTPEVPLVWIAHPARRRPRELALLAMVFFLTLAGVSAMTRSMFLTSLAAAIVVVGVAPFLFPTRYELSDWGVEARGLFRSRARSWEQLRRLSVGPGAALVSPLATPSLGDRYRGIYILFDGADRDRVVEILRARLEPPEMPETQETLDEPS